MVWIMLGNALLIFCLRLVDVSLGTVRLIMISRGRRKIAPLLGFLQIPFPVRQYVAENE